MTRKDYSLIAKVISGLRGYVEGTHCPVAELVYENFIDALKNANGNFNKDKFRTACERK